MKEQIKKYKVTDQICAWIFPNKKNYLGINISLNSRESLLSLFQIMLKFQYSSVNEIQLNQDQIPSWTINVGKVKTYSSIILKVNKKPDCQSIISIKENQISLNLKEQDLIKLQSAISNKIYDQSLIIGTTTLTFW